MKKIEALAVLAFSVFAAGCSKENASEEKAPEKDAFYISLEDVSKLLARAGVGTEQAQEVFDAAQSSASNGYDNEYLMKDIFASPGAGIGDDEDTKAYNSYEKPLRELLREAAMATKADGGYGEDFIDSLATSDIQIYWPFQEKWNGKDLPIITYDPGGADSVNVGFLPSGEKILVDEVMASERPVWVVSRNSDAGFTSLEMLRRQDPSWGQGGSGDIIVTPRTKASQDVRSLVLRSFKAKRQYDSWFAGASEFFVKVGYVKDMVFSSEEELLQYKTHVTDFMIVVRRNQVGQTLPFNALLVSEWPVPSEKEKKAGLYTLGFMLLEDDGGSQDTWKCTATVKYNSKSYGIEVSLPLNTRDDIVWRGDLSYNYIEKIVNDEKKPGLTGMGDVELVMELI